ncbi:MAG TPA: cation:proton antiporter [Longimicrobium sp.]|nr:cation:proton antiporter [Longimicrobium sp.]
MLAAILAGSGPPAYFVQAATVIVAGAVIAYAGARAGLVTIVGFLLAGVLIGPHALGLVSDPEMVDAAAELGVVLLLFTIGIEFSFERLNKIRRLILGGGTLQVVLATGVTAAVVAALGVDWRVAVFTGFLVALSSTAIVLKLLADRGETSRTHGQVGLGLLIFQDLAIIPMVLLLPVLGGQGGSPGEVALALGKAAGIIAAVMLVARRVMPPLLETVARTCAPELFLLTIIAVCFGTAYLTSLAGVSLSLGAFLAGLVVSESRFSEHALGEILPLQILFSATFFVSVGMLLDLGFLVRHLPLVLAAAAGVLAIKTLTTAASARLLGYRLPAAGAAGLLLAQVGEFSFVLNRAGSQVGLTPLGWGEDGSQTFIAATVLLMVGTPYLAMAASRLEARRGPHVVTSPADEEMEGAADELRMENHVIVAGYGAGARRLVRVLEGTGVPFVITTLSPEGAREAEEAGYPVLRGDSTRQRTLEHVGVERAKVMVIADDDAATASRITTVARMANPTMRIVVRTRYLAEVDALAAAGADRVLAEELEAVVQLFADVLREYRVAPEDIETQEAAVRAGQYAALRAAVLPPLPPCPLEGDCLEARTVTVRPGAPAAGRGLHELVLSSYGVRVRGIRRDGVWDETPEEVGVVLAPGTELALAGTAEAFARTAPLFRPAGGGLPAPPAPAPARAARRGGVDTEQVVTLDPAEDARCAHLGAVRPVHPGSRGCEECLRLGDDWVHLRVCMTCGHVGCCDDSKNRHATAHFTTTAHPVIRSIEPGETWGWCFVDKVEL